MPLFDCKQCGAREAGYWHCRDRRAEIKGILLKIGLFLGTLLLAGLAAVGAVKLG